MQSPALHFIARLLHCGVNTDLSCHLLVAVSNRDAESSKSAFVSSATALEEWIASAGLGGQLKGY
jgi:hypothetical protein